MGWKFRFCIQLSFLIECSAFFLIYTHAVFGKVPVILFDKVMIINPSILLLLHAHPLHSPAPSHRQTSQSNSKIPRLNQTLIRTLQHPPQLIRTKTLLQIRKSHILHTCSISSDSKALQIPQETVCKNRLCDRDKESILSEELSS